MRWIAIPMSLTVLMMAVGIASFTSWGIEQYHEFEQKQLDIQINYSVDAATQEMLNQTVDIGLDYVDFSKINVNPIVAWNTYRHMVLANFGWSYSDENYDTIENEMIPFFCVVSNDGYYMLSKTLVREITNGTSNDTYKLRWSPKVPFTIRDKGNLFNITLSGNTPTAIKNNNLLINYKGEEFNTLYRKKVIASELTRACNTALLRGSDHSVNNILVFPDILSENRLANAIESTSVITYLHDRTGNEYYHKGSFGVGGSRIDNADFRIGYVRSGKKYYTYPYNRSVIEAMGIRISRIYTSDVKAAEDGCYFDTELSINN